MLQEPEVLRKGKVEDLYNNCYMSTIQRGVKTALPYDELGIDINEFIPMEEENEVPQLYILRIFDAAHNYWSFEGGVDLTVDDKIVFCPQMRMFCTWDGFKVYLTEKYGEVNKGWRLELEEVFSNRPTEEEYQQMYGFQEQ